MIGHVVGNYKIVEKIGEGGMGAVFKGVDLMLEREVAIKALRPELASQPQVVERFRSEAVTLAKLNHPNIATLYSFFRQGHDFFMVMEFARGETLDRVIAAHGVMSCALALPMFCQALEGIEHAHRFGIIHRDIKPTNMMLAETGALKVLDFGIARVLGTSRLTKAGNLIGTIEYMSPEQVRGLETDARSDIYSLGMLLYEMLTGRVPFAGDSEFDIMKSQVEAVPPPPRVFASHIPDSVEAAILRAVAKKPEERFQTAGEFRQFLLGAGAATTTTHTTGDHTVRPTGNFHQAPDAATSLRPPTAPLPPETRLGTGLDQTATPPPAREAPAQPKETRLGLSVLSPPPGGNTSGTVGDNSVQFAPPKPAAEYATTFMQQPTPLSRPGFVYDDAPAPPPVSEAPPPPAVSASPRAPLNSKKLVFLVAGAALLLLVVTGAATLLLLRRSANAQAEAAARVEAARVAAATQATPAPTPDPTIPPPGMAYVPGGEFRMGNDGGDEYEKPAHAVTVEPFFIDKYEVINEEYEKFVKEQGHQPPPSWKDRTYPAGEGRRPVTGVNWDDANAYAVWAGKRLPTEAEWEFAARGPEVRRYPWGDEWQAGLANAGDVNQGMRDVGEYKGESPFGAFDMIGNAWEWTNTELAAYPGGQLPADHPGGDLKVIRGGYWGSKIERAATTTYRAGWPPTGGSNYQNTGFRCVRELRPAASSQ